MKKICLLLAAIMCLSLCACSKNTSYEAAEKLDGVWTATWDSFLGEMAHIYEFEYSGQDSGTCEFYNVMDGEVIVHYSSGVYEVKDGQITMDFHAQIENDGTIIRLDSSRQLTLSYTFEDGKLTVMDGDRQFLQTE
jgi:hypothetical protein